MGVFSRFRRKKKGTAEDVAEVSAVAEAAETGATDPAEGTEEATEVDGAVTRVAVAGLTAPLRSTGPAGSADCARNAPEAGAVAGAVGAVEIPRQQSAGTAADSDTRPDAEPETDGETGETARR
ncbi:hypothetical protein [Streptomyces omiyaensis]|uniref:Uncharacterized protein n=1 Tax=Streptomyces omiyaensis TaxID=68247 RepID=A0ABW7C2L4_9ACTN